MIAALVAAVGMLGCLVFFFRRRHSRFVVNKKFAAPAERYPAGTDRAIGAKSDVPAVTRVASAPAATHTAGISVKGDLPQVSATQAVVTERLPPEEGRKSQIRRSGGVGPLTGVKDVESGPMTSAIPSDLGRATEVRNRVQRYSVQLKSLIDAEEEEGRV